MTRLILALAAVVAGTWVGETLADQLRVEDATTHALVRSEPHYPAFHRRDWPHWIDADRDCQDTRQEVLLRDAIGTVTLSADGCRVLAGTWVCPLTGLTFTDPSDLDIDHIIPLRAAHDAGGAFWSRERRRKFANDLRNVVATYDRENASKGQRGPDEYRPQRVGFWCRYATTWEALGKEYGLRPTWDQARAIHAMQGLCQFSW